MNNLKPESHEYLIQFTTDAMTTKPNKIQQTHAWIETQPFLPDIKKENINITNAIIDSFTLDADNRYRITFTPISEGVVDINADVAPLLAVSESTISAQSQGLALSLLFDSTSPSVSMNQNSLQADPSASNQIQFTAVFSEPIEAASFTSADITNLGTALITSWTLQSTDQITWLITANVTSSGTVIATMAAGTVDDLAGNQSLPSQSTDNSVTVDLVSPSITINQAGTQTDPTGLNPVKFEVIFSEPIDPATFTSADIVNSGSSSIGVWVLATTDNITWTASTTASTIGTVIPTIPANRIKDIAGNNNTASTATDNSVTFDNSPVTVTLNQAISQPDPTLINSAVFNVVFNRPINPLTFDVGDISNSGTSGGISWALSTLDNQSWLLTGTLAAEGTVIPSIALNKVTDFGGNNNTASTATDNTVTYDITAPTVTIDQSGGQLDPINSLPISFTVVFSEAVDPATFTVADITNSGTSSGVVWSLSTANNITWTLSATTVPVAGTLVPSIAAGAFSDVAGNVNTAASTSTDNSVTYDITAPTVTINQAAGQIDPINGLPINFTVVFSEPIKASTFTSADITQSGTATGITWSLTTSDNITWNLAATPVAGAGTLVPSIALNKVTDVAGNNNTASTSTDNSVTYDITAPTLTINQAGGQADPTNTLPLTFTIVASEAVDPATFDATDITQNGTATGITWNLTTANNITWTLTATAITGAGTVRPSVAASKFKDVAGNNNSASTATDNTVTFDNIIPTVTINQKAGQLDPTNNGSIQFTAVFSEAIAPATLTSSDITNSGTATVSAWALSTTDNITWTLTATTTTNGTVIPNLSAGQVTDPAGNGNGASTSTDNTVTFDNVAPTVTINQKVGQADPISVLPAEFTIVFSEAINPASFITADITQNGTATGVSWSLTTSDNITFTLTALSSTSTGTLIPSIAASKVTDPAGNNNSASTATDNSVTYVAVSISIADATITEAGNLSFTVSLNSVHNQAVTFDWASSNGTATAGDDYTQGSGTGVTIPAGSISTNITIGTLSDLLDEDNETLNVTISNAAMAVGVVTLADNAALGTITDDDPTPTITFASAAQTLAESSGANSVTINLSAASGRVITVPYTISGTSLSPNDHNLSSGTLTINPGVTSSIINFSLVDDVDYEFDETLIITFGTLINAAAGTITTHTLTITSEDPPPTMSINDINIGEGDVAVFTVTLSGTSPYAASATWTTADGSALAGTDYTSATNTITIPAGSLTATFNVSTTENAINTFGSTKTFNVNLSGASNATLGDATGIGTIHDDDYAPNPFAISGVIGGIDIAQDNFLSDGLNPTVVWQSALGADRYTIVIRNAADTADVCAEVSTPTTSYAFNNCTLTQGDTYLVKATAWRAYSPLAAINNPYQFKVKTPPPVRFEILGVTGGFDATVDKFLDGGTNPTFHWIQPDTTSTYELTVYQSNGSTVACGPVNLPSNISSYDYSSCSLTNNNYKLQLVAKDTDGNSTPAWNSKFPFALPKSNSACGTFPYNVSITDSFLGYIYDCGGAAGNHGKNETVTYTIDPNGTNPVEITFESFATRDANDYLSVYDGTTTAGVPYGPFWGSTIPSPISASSGAAYLTWFSNGDGKVGAGYGLKYKAEPPSPGAFNILGATAATYDTVADAWLKGPTSTPTLSWGAASTALYYDVKIEDDQNRVVVCAESRTSLTSYTFSTCFLNQGSSYRVYVTAEDSWGVRKEATNNGFLFKYDQGPSAFSIAGITGGADVTINADLSDGYNPTLYFSDSIYETSYRATIYENDGTTVKCPEVVLPANIDTYTWTTCSVDNVSNPSYYKLKLVAYSESGYSVSASNSLYTFSVSSLPLAPGAFSISGVIGGTDDVVDTTLASVLTPTIKWAASPRATNYDVTVYENDGTTLKCATVNTTATSYNFSACTLTDATTYKVTVIANDPYAQSTPASNSGVFAFTVDVSPPGTFTITGVTGGLDTVADAVLLDGNNATIDWTAATGADNYRVYIYNSSSALACTGVFPLTTTSLQMAVSTCSLTENQTYKIKIAARDSVGNESYATNDMFSFIVNAKPTMSLTVKTFPEGIGTIVTSATLSHATLRDVTLTWSTTATGYTAVAGLDYTEVAPTVVTIPAGSTVASLSVAILEDTTEELTESFKVQITSTIYSDTTSTSAVMYIDDNDGENWIWKGTKARNWGVLGVADPLNWPSEREAAAVFKPASSSMAYVFGGYGVSATGSVGYLGDLWKYDETSNQWTWIAGPSSRNNFGIYGTQGVEAATNQPGARQSSATAVDSNGNLWMFGGYGYSSTNSGSLCDLWKFNTSTNQWTWIGGGANTCTAIWGTLGTPSTANRPAGRFRSHMWIDSNDKIWIFGGVNNNYYPSPYYNDLWKFDPVTSEWTWMNGNNTNNEKGYYGTIDVEGALNTPGARYGGGYTKGPDGSLYLYAGQGYDVKRYQGRLSDLWKLNPTNGLWTHINGPIYSNQTGVMNNDRVSTPLNIPTANAFGTIWVTGNYLWLYQGDTLNEQPVRMWKYDLVKKLWAVQKSVTSISPNTAASVYAGYSRVLTSPGSRTSGVGWVGNNGYPYLFSGYNSWNGTMNDLFYFLPDSLPKILVGDAQAIEGGTATNYASLNYPSASNVTFNWTSLDNSALAPADYAANSGNNVSITAGNYYFAMSTSVVADNTSEVSESFYTNISSATNATIIDSSGLVTLKDTDAYRVVIRGPTQLTTNTCSPAYYLEVVDRNFKTTTNPYTGETVTLANSSVNATVYSNSTCTTAITSISIATGAQKSGYFYYKNTTNETNSLSASPTFLLSSSQSITTVTYGAPTKISIVAGSTYTAGQCNLLLVSSRDAQSAPSRVASNTVANLFSETANIQLFSDSACSSPTTTTTIPSGLAFGSFYVKGIYADSVKYISAQTATLGSAKVGITIYSATSTSGAHYVVSGASSMTVDTCGTYVAEVFTASGQRITYNQYYTYMSSMFNSGIWSDSTCALNYGSAYSAYTTYSSTYSKVTSYYKPSRIGNDLLVYSYVYGTIPTTGILPITVTPSSPNKLVWTGPSSITASTCNQYTVSSQDSSNNPVLQTADLVLSLAHYSFSGSSSTVGFYSDAACTLGVTSATILNGTSSANVYFKHTTSSTSRILAASSTGLHSGYYRVDTNLGRKLTITGPININRAQCTQFQVNYLDSTDTPVNMASSYTAYFSGSDLGYFYADNSCTAAMTESTFLAGTNNLVFYYKNSFIDSSLNFRVNISSISLDAIFAAQTVQGFDANQLRLSGPYALESGACTALSVGLYSADLQPSLYGSDVQINFSGGGSGFVYSDSNCSVAINNITITSGQSLATVYYKNNSSELTKLYIADNGAVLAGGHLLLDISSGVSSISAGSGFTCMVKGGAAYCYGYNNSGQLGNGTSVNASVPTLVSGLSSGVTQVSAGSSYACAIQNGAAKCWGSNSSGRLGNGTFTNSLTPVQVSGLTANVTKILAGSNGTTCAIVSGALYCWGYNGNGNIGNNSTTASNVPVANATLTTGVTDVSNGMYNTCAVANGAGYCWGSRSYNKVQDGLSGTALVPFAIPNFATGTTKISVSPYAICALKDGAVQCWGYSDYGVLGNGTSSTYLTPQPATNLGSGVTDLMMSGTNSFACAVKAGNAYCWGYGYNCQLGRGDNNCGYTSVPAAVWNLSNSVGAISTGADHACAISANQPYCWGSNVNGQVGQADPPNHISPVQVDSFPALANKVFAGEYHTCATDTSNNGYCWGYNGYGQLGLGHTTSTALPTQVSGLSNIAKFAMGQSSTCALTTGGGVYCWGSAGDGQLGDGTFASKYSPTAISSLASGVTDLVSGNSHSCALVSGAVLCWGDNYYGQVGNGSFTDASSPTQVIGLESGVTNIMAGANYSCAVQSGAVKCWGYNGSYGAGYPTDGVSMPFLYALPNLASGITSIFGGGATSCALSSDGVYWCWGDGYSGQFATGSTFSTYSPLIMPLTSATTKISIGGGTVCSIISGKPYCWGNNSYGKVGYGGVSSTVYYPTALTLLTGVNDISAGANHTCAVETGTNKLYCWGDSSNGKLGFLSRGLLSNTISEPQYVIFQ